MRTKGKFIFSSLLFLCLTGFVFAQDLHHNPWELIIYRPQNNGDLNYVRCRIKLQDAQTGEDVTYTKAKATYEWASIPNRVNYYKKSYYLDSGMAAHLNLQSGQYKITVYTDNSVSNTFYYDTQNPTKVIFVIPVANENGFYTGSFRIDYKAPKYYKMTQAVQE